MSVNCLGYSALTVSNTAVGFTYPQGAHGLMATVESANVRWRADGTDPTSTTGHLLSVGDIFTLDSWTAPGQNWKQIIKAIRFIRTDGVDAGLKISWFD